MREKLLALVEEKGDHPPLPEILTNLERKVNDPDCDVLEISAIIETEPVAIINFFEEYIFEPTLISLDDKNLAEPFTVFMPDFLIIAERLDTKSSITILCALF